MKELNNKPIFKKSLAFKLIDMGNKLIDVIPNDRNPKYLIFYFEDNEKFENDLSKIQSK